MQNEYGTTTDKNENNTAIAEAMLALLNATMPSEPVGCLFDDISIREKVRARSFLPWPATPGFDMIKFAKDEATKTRLRAVYELSVGAWPTITGTSITWHAVDVVIALLETSRGWTELCKGSKHFRRQTPEASMGFYEIWRAAVVSAYAWICSGEDAWSLAMSVSI